MKATETLAQIQHIACLGLPSEISIPAMVQVADTLIHASNSNFAWTDRQGRMANYYARYVDPHSLDLMLNHSHLLTQPGELNFEMHARSMLVTGNLEKFRNEDNLDHTIAYNEIWRPNAMERLLDLVVHDAEGPRGLLTFGRRANEGAFSNEEIRLVLALKPWILHALDTPPRAEGLSVESGDEAVLLCDYSGKVVQMGENAARLLLYAGNGRITSGIVIPGLGDAVPDTVRKVCGRMARILAGGLARVPNAQLQTPFGAFHFRAHSLSEELLAVVIRREQPLPLTLVGRAARLPLTPRQRQVAVLIGLGQSPESIQAELDLTPGTYRRHVEDIHVRLNVSSRAELMTVLMAPVGSA